MKQKRAYRLNLIRLLMFMSTVFLLVLMYYWLRSQYGSEKDKLKKDLTLQFEQTQQSVADSVLMIKLIKPILSKNRPNVMMSVNMNINDSHKTIFSDTSLLKEKNIDSILAHAKGSKIQQIQINKGNNELMMQGVKLIIKSTAGLSDSLGKQFLNIDTVAVRKLFVKKINADEKYFIVRNMSGGNKNKEAIYISSLMSFEDNGIEVTAFNNYLFKKMIPQFVFSLVLIMLTLAAFIVSLRSLRQQMRLSLMKDELVSNMSHELKTPVATVKVALEALGEADVLEDKKTAYDYISMASSEINRLEMLINQTLNTAMAEQGKMDLQKQKTDLKQLTEEVIRALRLKTDQQNVELKFSPDDHPYFIDADKLHVQGVLLNVIDNGIKYGGTLIRLQLKKEQNKILLSVTDNGIGIPPEYQQKVFEKFFRVPAHNRHDVKGYGLGLSYAAQVMQQHGGKISVHNNPESGATFTISFPEHHEA